MRVTRNPQNIVQIRLAGTPVKGSGNPHHGEGTISLTAYGAKRFAYELLLEATDAEWYASHSGAAEDIQLMSGGKIPLPTEEPEENDTPLTIEKEELIKKIGAYVYPTTQIMNGELTFDEYVISMAKFFANELFGRRMEIKALPLLAELACILHNLGEIEY